MKIFNSLLEIEGGYKGFILDIFGVLHTSGVMYPNVLNALQTLKARNKKVILLSNAPRRATFVKKYLSETVGIDSSLYDNIFTSGEIFALEMLKSEGKTVFYIGPEKDLPSLQNLNLKITTNIEDDFNFSVITGISPEGFKILPILQAKRKKMYCINPDIFIVKSNGEREECAGFLAKEYEKLGGEVIYIGKPYKQVYDYTLDFFSNTFPEIKKNEILAVGDGIETDVLGANNNGISSCLCLSGLPSLEENLEDFIANLPYKPNFIIKAL
jgi:HAD superfamily hydrolase (TIGR01459 family)